MCTACNGTRVKKDSKEIICGYCDGKGYTVEELGHTISQIKCEYCNGFGKSRPACLTCNGIGTIRKQVEEIIKIPRGVFDGLNLRLSGKGNQSEKGAAGDLLIKVKVKQPS